MSNYERLIFFAKETNSQTTSDIITELNELLSSQDVNSIKVCDLQILDDLISMLSNTDNLLSETRESIIILQEIIRSRMFD
jgi:hypothetical protein